MTSTRRVTRSGAVSDQDCPLRGLVQHHGDVEHVLRLEPEVELFDDRLGEELDQCGKFMILSTSMCFARTGARAAMTENPVRRVARCPGAAP